MSEQFKKMAAERYPKMPPEMMNSPYFKLLEQVLPNPPPPIIDYGTCHVPATPLLEVFGVHVDSDLFHDGNPCEIYGQVNVVDGQDTIIALYNRPCEGAQSISPTDGSLLLQGPLDGPISPCADLRLEIQLWEKLRGIEIASGGFPLDFHTQDDDIVQVQTVPGKHGCATVVYSSLRAAVIAYVEIQLIDKASDGNTSCFPLDVYGDVVAHYANNYNSSSISSGNLSTVLFKRPADKPVRVEDRTPMELSKAVVSVPAYASLMLHVQLMSASGAVLPHFDGPLEFAADYCDPSTHKIEDGCYMIEVIVHWEHEDMLRPRIKEKKSRVMKNLKHKIKEESASDEEQEKKPRLPFYQPSSERGVIPKPVYDKKSVGPLMEVFSVYIGCEGGKAGPLGLYGKVEVVYGPDICKIFDKQKDHPEYLLPGTKTLPLSEYNQSFSAMDVVGVYIDLKDVQDQVVIKGFLQWNYHTKEAWYDRRMSSVIRGSHGYASVHYSMFETAVQAKVTIDLSAKGSSNLPINVHGSLFSQYGHWKWNFSNEYERNYYRSKLFERVPENPLELHHSSQLTLLKSVISVPVGSSLIISGDLIVKSAAVEQLKCNNEFMSKTRSVTYGSIDGQYFHVSITVEWL